MRRFTFTEDATDVDGRVKANAEGGVSPGDEPDEPPRDGRE